MLSRIISTGIAVAIYLRYYFYFFFMFCGKNWRQVSAVARCGVSLLTQWVLGSCHGQVNSFYKRMGLRFCMKAIRWSSIRYLVLDWKNGRGWLVYSTHGTHFENGASTYDLNDLNDSLIWPEDYPYWSWLSYWDTEHFYSSNFSLASRQKHA